MSSQPHISSTDRFLRIAEVVDTVGLSRSEIYRLINRDSFPPPIKIELRARRNAPALWVAREVQAWMKARIDEWRGRGDADTDTKSEAPAP
jgi:predicted DNA-binding transcriptional regulator AlpA